MAWLGTFKYRRKITISNTNVDAILSNFPILIKISASSGTGSTDITDIFTELTGDANRKKIAITTSDGTTQCYVEIERFGFANSLAWFWVKVPSVAAASVTELYIYYDVAQSDNTTYVGDTTDAVTHNVWDANFVSVWHLHNATTSTVKDSTLNGHDGTKYAVGNPNEVAGKIGKCQEFVGNDEADSDITVTDHSDFDLQSDFTLESILYCDAFGDAGDNDNYVCRILNKDDNPGGRSWNYCIRGEADGANVGKQMFFYDVPNNTRVLATNPISITTWTATAISFNNTTSLYSFYEDGIVNGSATLNITPLNNGGNVTIGGGEAPSIWVHDWDGKLDELRVSSTVRSAAWIKATYYSNWDELVLYGAVEAHYIVVALTSPLESIAKGACNIKVKIVPGLLSATTSISVEKIFKGFVIKCLEALTGESTGQSNIKIKIKPPSPLSSIGSLSVSKIFKGYIVHLIDSLKGESSGNSNIKIGLKPGTLTSPGVGQSNIKVSIKSDPLSATSSMAATKISTFVKRITKLINSFGEQSQDGISVALGLEDRQSVRLDLSPGAQEIQAMINSICEGDVSSIQKLIGEIAEKDPAIGTQKILQSLKNLTVTFPTVTYDILLDGISIKGKVEDAVVTYREDSVHNSVNIRSIHNDLFWNCNPADLEGVSRIEVQIDGRQMYFLVEKRSGDEKNFSLWGRSISAREDTPYAEELDYSLDAPKSAKDVAEEILEVSSLDWQCEDWILPSSFEFDGVPISGVLQIANAIGAVVRCKDDGTIYVRQRFPVRPINANGASATVNYDRANLTRLDYSNIKGSQYNAVEVIGATDDVNLPEISIEETGPTVGDTVHIRVYWAGDKPSGIIETYVTDGIIIALGELTTEEDESETVIFNDGVGSVSKPITSIINIEWIGDSGGEVLYEQYSKDVEIADEAYRIAEITYKTTYSRYRIAESNVELLLALLTFGGESDVSVEVIIEEGDKPAPNFNSPLLTSQSIAVVAGTAWLDKNKYNRKQVVLETPYNSDAIDGVLALVNDAEIDCVGNFHISACRTLMKGSKVVNELGVIQLSLN